MPFQMGSPTSSGGGSGGSGRMPSVLDSQSEDDIQPSISMQTKTAYNVNLLKDQIPGLAAQPDVLLQLATAYPDSATMLDAAFSGVGFSEVHKMASEMQTWDPMHQRSEWGLMTPQKQAALASAGYQPPAVTDPEAKKKGKSRNPLTGSFWKGVASEFLPGGIADTAKDAAKLPGAALGALAGVPVVGPVVKKGLEAMSYGLGEVSRLPRSGDYLADSAKAQQELQARGVDPTQFSQRTGVFLPGNAESKQQDMTGFGNLFSSDYWKTWNHNGHNGEDDILPTRQVDAYYTLEESDSTTAVENFNIAREMAGGKGYDDIALKAGYQPGTPEYQAYVSDISQRAEDPKFKEALDKLTMGKISPGRQLARGAGIEDKDLNHGVGKWVSGSADATFSLVFDPTMHVGKVTKAAEAARWAVKTGDSAEQLNRWQELASTYQKFKSGEDVAEDLAKVDRAGGLAARRVTGDADKLAEGKAVFLPAQKIADAWNPAVENYNLANLTREMPVTSAAVPAMAEFDNALKAERGYGIRTVDDVFDFYKDAAGAKALAGGSGKSAAETLRLFGDNPHKMIMPTLTAKGQAVLATKNAFRTALIDGKPNKALAEAVTEAVGETAEKGTVPAGSLDPEMNWRPPGSDWEAEKQNRLRKTVGAFTTLTAGRTVALEGAESIKDFSRLAEYGSFVDMPRVTKDRYLDAFARGNQAQRAQTVNLFLKDFFDHSGGLAIEDEAGQAFVNKFTAHANQAYGLGDQVPLGVIPNAENPVLLTKDAVFSNQLADKVAIPSFQELLDATRKANQTRRVFSGIRNSLFETYVGKAWKPAQMMRLGFITRNAGEEIVTFSLRNSFADYLKSKIAVDWMEGLKSAGAGKGAEFAQSAFLRPVTGATYGIRTLMGVGDEAIAEAAHARLLSNPEFASASQSVKDSLLDAEMGKVRATKRVIPRSVMWLDDQAKWLSATMGEGFHQIAQAAHIPTKQEIGEALLRGNMGDTLHLASTMLMDHPVGETGFGEFLGKQTFEGASGYTMRDGSRYTMMHDPASPTGMKAIKMRADRSNFQWASHEAIDQFYFNYHQMLDGLNGSVQGRAGLGSLSGFLNPSTKDELGKLFEADGSQVARDLRAQVQSAAPEDQDAVRKWLKHGGKPQVADPALAETLDKLDQAKATARTRAWLSPDASGFVTDDPKFLREQLSQSIYNGMRRLDNEDVIRKMVRTNAGVAQGLPSGVSRLYLPMADRRAAEGLGAVLSTKEGADTFAKNLEAELNRRGLKRHMKDVWDAATPGRSGFSVSDMMDSIKAKQIVDGGEWIPVSMAASSNADIAMATRDAMARTFDELGVPQTISPTIGHLDFDQTKMTAPFGVNQVSDDVFHIDPPRATKATPLDPRDMVTQLKVQLPSGDHMWVGEHEVNDVLGPVAQANIEQVENHKLANFAEYDERTKKLQVNPQAIRDDWANGASYLRGEGKASSRRLQGYKYADEAGAAEVDQALSELTFRGKKFPDLGELTSKYRGVKKALREELKAGEAEWVLRDPVWGPLSQHGILDDVIAHAETATASKGVTRTIKAVTGQTEAKAMAHSLEAQGIDVDKLVREIGSPKRYEEFLTEREKAHLSLAHRQVRPGTEMTGEALHREQQATAQAVRQMGIDPERIAAEGRKVELPAFEFGEGGSGVKVLDSIIGSGQTEDVAVRKAAETAADNMVQMLATPDGEVMHELLHHIKADDYDMSDLWTKGKIQDMPARAYGPQLVTPTDGRWERVVNNYYEGVASPAMTALSRTAAFRFNVAKASEQTRFVFDILENKELHADALRMLKDHGIDANDFETFNRLSMSRLDQEAVEGDHWHTLGNALKKDDHEAANGALQEIFGNGKKLNDDELATLKDWTANQHMAWSEWRDASMVRGKDLTIPFIDDHAIRSQFQEYLGSLIPFWYSEEQFLKRMAKTVAQTPEAFRKAQLLMHGARSMGVVRKDTNGNEIIVWPGGQVALQSIAEVAHLLSGGMFSVPQSMPLTSKTANLIQGWNADQAGHFNFGPAIGLPLEFLTRRFPELQQAQEQISPTSNHGYLNYLLPASVTNLYNNFKDDPSGPGSASAILQAAQILAATGHAPKEDATPLETEHYLEKLRGTARTVGLVRTLSSFSGFGNATPDQTAFSKEFSELLRQGVSPSDAIPILIERHGADALPFTVFGSERGESGAPLPATEAAADFMAQHEDYLKAYPAAAAWLLPQEKESDKFSYRAYNEALALGLRVKRSPEEMVKAIQIAQASGDYWKMKGEYDAKILASDGKRAYGAPKSDETKALEAQWKTWKDGYLAQHPVFAEDISTNKGGQRRAQTLNEMRRIVNDPGAPPSDTLDSIKGLVNSYWEYKQQVDSFSGLRGKQVQVAKDALKADFLRNNWVNMTPQAKAFYNSVIAPELDGEPLPLSLPNSGGTHA